MGGIVSPTCGRHSFPLAGPWHLPDGTVDPQGEILLHPWSLSRLLAQAHPWYLFRSGGKEDREAACPLVSGLALR